MFHCHVLHWGVLRRLPGKPGRTSGSRCRIQLWTLGWNSLGHPGAVLRGWAWGWRDEHGPSLDPYQKVKVLMGLNHLHPVTAIGVPLLRHKRQWHVGPSRALELHHGKDTWSFAGTQSVVEIWIASSMLHDKFLGVVICESLEVVSTRNWNLPSMPSASSQAWSTSGWQVAGEMWWVAHEFPRLEDVNQTSSKER